jgi:hypothetical protein
LTFSQSTVNTSLLFDLASMVWLVAAAHSRRRGALLSGLFAVALQIAVAVVASLIDRAHAADVPAVRRVVVEWRLRLCLCWAVVTWAPVCQCMCPSQAPAAGWEQFPCCGCDGTGHRFVQWGWHAQVRLVLVVAAAPVGLTCSLQHGFQRAAACYSSQLRK